MVIEKITHETPYARNFTCICCENKIRTDDFVFCTSYNNKTGMLTTWCLICDAINQLPYTERDDPKIDGEEYINYEDYMNKGKEGSH